MNIEVRQLKVPLRSPYKLSFGTVYAFDTLLVILRDKNGRIGFGEATLLPGYTDETIEESYSSSLKIADEISGQSINEMTACLEPIIKDKAFTATAFLTALDVMNKHPLLTRKANVPLLAILSSSGQDIEELRDEIEKLIANGYHTLKFKVGFDPESDIRAVENLQKANNGRAGLRIDANQGYSADEAVRFLQAITPDSIELVEQTCDKSDWQAAVQSRQAASVPIMLDESIYGTSDIEMAKSLNAADFIKLKLMKLGNLDKLNAALNLIKRNGMTPVLGNGVATDIGCWMEACIADETIENAGEMNGFLKTDIALLDPPLVVEGDSVVLKEDLPGLNFDALDDVTVQSHSF